MTSLADRIKQFEGYTSKPAWDYKQWSVGYGTRASGPDDIVDEAEAVRRLNAELAPAAAIVDKAAPGVAPGVRDALISLTYNAGGAWTRAGLGEAIRTGDLPRARELFLQYNKAGGQELPGLVKRRQSELAWWDAPADSNPAPGAAPASPAIALAAAPQIAASEAPRGLLGDLVAQSSQEAHEPPQPAGPSPFLMSDDIQPTQIDVPRLRRLPPRSRLALARSAARGRA